MKTILVTGGAGYIGSHTCVELLESGFDVVVVDNLCNADKEAVRRVEEIAKLKVTFYEADCCSSLDFVFEAHSIDAVIHFASLKAVGESVKQPLAYYSNNLISTISLLQTMERHKCYNLVFSSSATVYGDPDSVPIPESARLNATNPYGQTKLFIEQILRDVVHASPALWRIYILRYFNPIGAHPSGRIGEDPHGMPNNLMPFVAQVAIGKRPHLNVFGDQYDTEDGTGVRDYIHVVDLARGHVAALTAGIMQRPAGCFVYNLGSGEGTSVLHMVRAMEKAAHCTIAYQ